MHLSPLYVGVITLLVGTLFVGHQPVHAFWPFDKTETGQVRGEQTQSTGGLFQSFFRKPLPKSTPNPSFMPLPSGEKPEYINDKMTTEILGKRLEEAVKNGKMTTAQKNTVLSHIKGIEMKRKELRDQEKAFQDWLKTNNVILPFLFRPAAPESLFSQNGPSGATGYREIQKPMNPRVNDRKVRMDTYEDTLQSISPTASMDVTQ